MADLGLFTSVQQNLSQQQALTAALVQRMSLFTMPVLELQTKIATEIEANPALEFPEDRFDEKTDSPSSESEREEDDLDSSDYSDLADARDFDSSSSDAKTKFLENIGSGAETLSEALFEQLNTLEIDDDLYETASLLISDLDTNGFFIEAPESAIPEDLHRFIPSAVSLVQSFEPLGVCVEDFRHSLLLQAKARLSSREDYKIVSKILLEHFELLKPSKFPALARTLGISENDVNDYYDFIRTLDPYPASQYASAPVADAVPEFSILKTGEGGLEIVMNRSSLPNLRISPEFTSMADSLSGEQKKEARKFINESVQNARALIDQVELRFRTLNRTALALADLQKDFFLKGPSYLKPMTLSDVARIVEVDESTISRIAKDKYCLTDFGLVPIRKLFTTGLKVDTQVAAVQASDEGSASREVVKKRIEEIISANTAGKKLSDQKICDILTAEGIKISRRTVAKYRTELGMDSSFDR